MTTPRDDRPIAQDGGKSTTVGLDLLHVLQLLLDSTVVATIESAAPCDDRLIAQDGGKSTIVGLDLLHILQLVPHSTAVATMV